MLVVSIVSSLMESLIYKLKYLKKKVLHLEKVKKTKMGVDLVSIEDEIYHLISNRLVDGASTEVNLLLLELEGRNNGILKIEEDI